MPVNIKLRSLEVGFRVKAPRDKTGALTQGRHRGRGTGREPSGVLGRREKAQALGPERRRQGRIEGASGTQGPEGQQVAVVTVRLRIVLKQVWWWRLLHQHL